MSWFRRTCDECGKKVDRRYEVEVEGKRVNLCAADAQWVQHFCKHHWLVNEFGSVCRYCQKIVQ